ncbi:MORN repeat-containing protein 5 [Plasmodiophora brassicae]|uniref:MORN repeat-containing protein 5 n=1 Tax=Plasmodiophora brassicae TaxID=37360 RepID=A0A0G4IWJ3_PLABS|nr:hypothetical protein PBRA_007263 [Plasmodiophora brassicae]SPQ95974.1 unnamed protein product [Plasmodiophora brassicae]
MSWIRAFAILLVIAACASSSAVSNGISGSGQCSIIPCDAEPIFASANGKSLDEAGRIVGEPLPGALRGTIHRLGPFYNDTNRNESMHGSGQVQVNGAVYNGEFMDGWLHGHGIMRYPSGAVYDGGWRYGVRHGRGTLTIPKLKHTLAPGHPSTVDGVEVDATCTKYVGEWAHDRQNGTGYQTSLVRVSYRRGLEHQRCLSAPWAVDQDKDVSYFEVYNGTWLYGSEHGFGRYTYYNGRVFEGQWDRLYGRLSGRVTYFTGAYDLIDVVDGKENRSRFPAPHLSPAATSSMRLDSSTGRSANPSGPLAQVAKAPWWGDKTLLVLGTLATLTGGARWSTARRKEVPTLSSASIVASAAVLLAANSAAYYVTDWYVRREKRRVYMVPRKGDTLASVPPDSSPASRKLSPRWSLSTLFLFALYMSL